MSPNRVKYRHVTFPKSWIPAIKCSTCRHSVLGYYIQDAYIANQRITTKWFHPCMHEMTPPQEQAIINDMMKRGI